MPPSFSPQADNAVLLKACNMICAVLRTNAEKSNAGSSRADGAPGSNLNGTGPPNPGQYNPANAASAPPSSQAPAPAPAAFQFQQTSQVRKDFNLWTVGFTISLRSHHRVYIHMSCGLHSMCAPEFIVTMVLSSTRSDVSQLNAIRCISVRKFNCYVRSPTFLCAPVPDNSNLSNNLNSSSLPRPQLCLRMRLKATPPTSLRRELPRNRYVRSIEMRKIGFILWLPGAPTFSVDIAKAKSSHGSRPLPNPFFFF